MKGHYPVNSKGDMIEYVEPYYDDSTPAEWLPMGTFIEQMNFYNYEQGRSKLRFICKDSKGRKWSIMAQSIDDFVLHSVVGSLLGKWEVVKRGSNYGVILKEIV